MCYEGGIREFVTWLNRNKTPLHERGHLSCPAPRSDSMAEVAMQYNDSYNETLVSFANDIHTPEGGMHETGFKAALTRVLNAYGHEIRACSRRATRSPARTVREGLTAVISVKLTEAQFEGQTKAKLGNADIRTLVDNVVSDQLVRVSGGAPGGGPDHPGQGPDRQPGPGGRPEGPGVHPPQDRPGRRGHARQAPGLQRE